MVLISMTQFGGGKGATSSDFGDAHELRHRARVLKSVLTSVRCRVLELDALSLAIFQQLFNYSGDFHILVGVESSPKLEALGHK